MSLYRYQHQEAKNIAKAKSDAMRNAKVDASMARRKAKNAASTYIESLQAEITSLTERVSFLEAAVTALTENTGSEPE